VRPLFRPFAERTWQAVPSAEPAGFSPHESGASSFLSEDYAENQTITPACILERWTLLFSINWRNTSAKERAPHVVEPLAEF
jgi:hypothetical protein